MRKINMVTISYAMKRQEFERIVFDLDDMFKDVSRVTKTEVGSEESEEGHHISYKVDGEEIFWAMIHSNGQNYLVRADDKLIEVQV